MGVTVRRHPGCIVLTRGDREVVVWGGRDWRRSDRGVACGVGWGRAAHCRPEWSACDRSLQMSAQWPLLSLRWHRVEDQSTEWTGRDWALYAWAWNWPRLSVETPTRYRCWPALPRLHVLRPERV
jgi:hypothetical protein